ncbi:MAG TPA: asparagine synthase (glutamine-hydrolyzing) [Thermoanaerobaculia bacterium]|jgi:asparagine synthase (glutamine-hydrolysing)|nr:asparagine synthase (glutamine-hydrolyzing) [Thermoanaerobaculia bacterium]
MCGIAALFAYGSAAPPVDRDEIEAITERMRPRGPDAGGTWISSDTRVALGARRLAIIDLTDEGTQPMTDVDGELHIVFNGEIYNYRELRARLERLGARFHSTTDTEVLLQLYRHDGQAMVELLRGMFAFVIWDPRSRRMFAARDPYGIKPLYIADDGQTFRAASTVKALLAGGRVGRALDPAGVAGFWLMGSVPEPHTIFRSIRAVEAGTSLDVDARGVHDVRRYYSIAATLQRGVRDVAAAHLVQPPVLLRELVTDSLRHHLIADVPVGAFLSSGIDSTALVSLATEATGQPPRTVTLRFDEFRGRESDEAPLAERFARELGSDHVTRLVTRDEFTADLPRLFDAMDQPTIDGTNTWFVSKAASERGLKVALSGLGGDELFGSYPSFRDLPRIVGAARLPLAAATAGRLTRNPKAAAMAQYGGTWSGAYLLKRGLFLPDDLPSLMGADAAREGLERLAMLDHIAATIDPDPGTPFGRVASLEASLYMRNQLLRDTDWASMAHSLEVRTPLVDATLLRQIAPLLMVEKQRCKRHFAKSPRTPLPFWLSTRHKTGFSVPLAAWAQLRPDGTSMRMRSWARLVMEQWA